jgi:hypothetical protein
MAMRRGATALVVACAAWLPVPHPPPTPFRPSSLRPELRIPEGSRPLRYAVTLTVVPGEAAVAGEIAIDIELDRPHRSSGSMPSGCPLRRRVSTTHARPRVWPRIATSFSALRSSPPAGGPPPVETRL